MHSIQPNHVLLHLSICGLNSCSVRLLQGFLDLPLASSNVSHHCLMLLPPRSHLLPVPSSHWILTSPFTFTFTHFTPFLLSLTSSPSYLLTLLSLQPHNPHPKRDYSPLTTESFLSHNRFLHCCRSSQDAVLTGLKQCLQLELDLFALFICAPMLKISG